MASHPRILILTCVLCSLAACGGRQGGSRSPDANDQFDQEQYGQVQPLDGPAESSGTYGGGPGGSQTERAPAEPRAR
ncbi:MAG: hypothetical protein KF718_18580 [Polyangiaceae bacterium]|nr:hypothetical protein [Polyangiaceae bacterium]